MTLRGLAIFAPLNMAFFLFSLDMLKLKRFPTYPLELELSTRSTNGKKGLLEILTTRRKNPQAPSCEVYLIS